MMADSFYILSVFQVSYSDSDKIVINMDDESSTDTESDSQYVRHYLTIL